MPADSHFSVAGPRIYLSNLSLSVCLTCHPCIPIPIFSTQASIILRFVWHRGSDRLSIHSPAASCDLSSFSDLDRFYVIANLPLFFFCLPDTAATPPSCISILVASAFCATEQQQRQQQRTYESRLTKGAINSPEPCTTLASIDPGGVETALLIETR